MKYEDYNMDILFRPRSCLVTVKKLGFTRTNLALKTWELQGHDSHEDAARSVDMQLRERDSFVSTVLCGSSSSSTEDSPPAGKMQPAGGSPHCVLRRLNAHGNHHACSLKRLIAEYAGVPVGNQLADLRMVQDQLLREEKGKNENEEEIAIGMSVTIIGLQKKPELNGASGVVEKFMKASGRYAVRASDGKAYKIKPSNLKPAGCDDDEGLEEEEEEEEKKEEKQELQNNTAVMANPHLLMGAHPVTFTNSCTLPFALF